MKDKKARLTRERIAEVLRKGRRFSTPFFSLSTLPSPTEGSKSSSIAVVISSRNEKSSVKRHLLKRRIQYYARTQGLSTKDRVLIVQKKATTLSYKELSTTLNDIMSRTDA